MDRPNYAPPPKPAPVMVDPAQLLALRAMLDQILGSAIDSISAAPCALLTIAEPYWQGAAKSWAAELVLLPSGSIERSFLRGRRDYTDVDKKGRGVKLCFVLRPGCVYEVHAVERQRDRRYLCRVTDGAIAYLTPGEAQRWSDGLLFADARYR